MKETVGLGVGKWGDWAGWGDQESPIQTRARLMDRNQALSAETIERSTIQTDSTRVTADSARAALHQSTAIAKFPPAVFWLRRWMRSRKPRKSDVAASGAGE